MFVRLLCVVLAVLEVAVGKDLPVRRSLTVKDSGRASQIGRDDIVESIDGEQEEIVGETAQVSNSGMANNVKRVMAQVGSLTEVVADLRAKLQKTEEKLQRAEVQKAEFVGVRSQVEEIRKGFEDLQEHPNANAINNVPEPQTMLEDGTVRKLNIADRLRYLERKFAGASNWLNDPQLWMKTQHKCKNSTFLHSDHEVCLDNFARPNPRRRSPNCVVYDLGIHAEPEFGMNLMKEYGCSVRAYDPSDISAKWWSGDSKTAKVLRAAGESKYKFHSMAAGGNDGPLELFQYNWNQVSIVKQERDTTIKDWKKFHQKSFTVPAKTLGTMMRENKDTWVDILKIDIEGSEYMFLQNAFDTFGCPPVGQIAIEYHHFSLDERYGSSADINTIHNLLNSCGFKSFNVGEHWRSAVTPDEKSFYVSPKRYSITSYCRDCWL